MKSIHCLTIPIQALVLGQSSADQHIKNITNCARGIMFLGTPHEGSDKAKWAETGQKFAKMVGKNTNKEMIKVLIEDSIKLSELGVAFLNFLRSRGESKEPGSKVEVVCFFEEYPTSIGVIVSKTSAMIAGYESQSIPADHSEMCKFASKNELGYQRVSNVLRRWTEMIGTPPEIEKTKVGDIHDALSATDTIREIFSEK
ncbi:Serine active site containing protein 1 [Sticta canariensis]|nr:Serine active site containing protein 1 [Sticta canariensis]